MTTATPPHTDTAASTASVPATGRRAVGTSAGVDAVEHLGVGTVGQSNGFGVRRRPLSQERVHRVGVADLAVVTEQRLDLAVDDLGDVDVHVAGSTAAHQPHL